MSDENQSVKTSWTSIQVYALSVLFLLAGVTAGYLARGSRSSKISGETASAMTQAQGGTSSQPGVIPPGVTPEQMTPDQLKRMADKKVAPLLQQLNENPNDRDKLIEVGGDYYLAQQFNEAAAYYEKADRGHTDETLQCAVLRGEWRKGHLHAGPGAPIGPEVRQCTLQSWDAEVAGPG